MSFQTEDLWNFKGKVNPSSDLIDLFEKWDKSKSTTKRNVCYNRAKLWIGKLLNLEVQIPQAYKLRHEDIQSALEHMFQICFAKGMSPKEYLIFCMDLKVSNSNEMSEPKVAHEIIEEINEENDKKSSRAPVQPGSSGTPTTSGVSTSNSEKKTGKVCKSTLKGLEC